MPKHLILLFCAGLFAAPLLHGESNALKLYALSRASAPEQKLMLALKLLKEDPENRIAVQEIHALLLKSSPGMQRKIADALLTFAENNPLPNALVWKFVSWSIHAGEPVSRGAALCRKVIENTPPPAPGAAAQEIRDYLELLDSAAYAPPFALAADSPRYQKVWEASPDLPWAKSICTNFFFLASRLAPQERRLFGLQQSESAEYGALYRKFFASLTLGSEPERLIAMGYACRAGETEKALKIMKTLSFGNPRLEEITQRERSGDRAGAIACCRKYLKDHPAPLPQLQLQLASMLFLNGETEEAGRAAEEAYKQLPQKTALLLGMIRIATGREKAVSSLVPTLTRDEAIQLHIALLTRKKRYRDAVQAGKNYLKTHPESAQLVFSCLYAPIQYGKLSDAAGELLVRMRELGMLQSPGHANDLGYTLASLGIEMQEAERLLEHAAANRPLDPPILDSLAFLRCRQGRMQEAWELISRALQLARPDMEPFSRAEMLGHAADIALALGRKDDALRLYRKALVLPVMPLAPFSPRPDWQRKIDQLTGKPAMQKPR